ncbi:MAG: hypothetical protein OXG66_11060 [Acidimicrobiaceae bacterium]|nr:hypothetical protein [Acidimicrobiaceae bacterium]MYA14394.1 hypothetical protein [Acidimicrobiaceae bacterium]MYE64636.1 hypothetical protein [Acidimicrobiaceae bacterium]
MPDAGPRDSEAADSSSDAPDGEERAHPLLEIQRLDTETEQLHHRRDNLSQRQDLSAVRTEQAELQAQIDTVALQRIEVLTRQKRLEDEAAIIQAKADIDDNRLYSGEITAIRDLQALQDEIKGLRSRQGMLEERAIEALMEAEELTDRAESLEEQRRSCDERVTVLEAELASAEATIHGQLAALSTARTEAAEVAETAAVARYERMRETFGPSTAVRFDPSSGCGCPHQMPAVEVARIKRCAEGEVLDCAECGRLVLR